LGSYELGVAFASFSVLSTAGNRVLLSKPLTQVDSRFASYIASLVGVTLLLIVDITVGEISYILSAPSWELILFCAVGVLNSGVSRLLLYIAIRHLGANQAEILQSTTTLFAFLFAATLLHEGISATVVGGGVLIVAGSLMVEARLSADNRRGNPTVGVVSALLSSLVFALVLILVKAGLLTGYPYISAAAISSLAALGFNTLLYNPKKLASDIARTPKNITASIAGASGLIALSQVFRFGAFSYASAVVVSAIISTSPALVVLLNHAAYNKSEIVSLKTIISVVLVVVGGIIVSHYEIS
jgi:drug/metabolite transporter (DMT)-like permease